MAKTRKKTLRNIAYHGQDLEEMLLQAWEEGCDYLTSVDTPIKRKDLKRLYEIYSTPKRSKITKKSYWMQVLQINEGELRELLESLGCKWIHGTPNVPRKCIKQLKEEAIRLKGIRSKGIISAPTSEVVQEEIIPELDWREIGHTGPNEEIRYLSYDEIKQIHFELAKNLSRQSDPIYPAGVMSESLLESALYRPQTSFAEALKYPTIQMAAAALIHSIIHNHPFHNGNKRTALVSMLVMLDENNVILDCPEDEVFKQVMRIAKHNVADKHPKDRNDRETLAIAEWINQHSRFIKKGERPIQFRKLRSILTDFGCEIGPKNAGKIIVTRIIKGKGIFSVKRKRSFLLHCRTDGQEIDQQQIARLRKELELDEEHGVDSRGFYELQYTNVEGFIQIYRKTLQRLAKL